MLAQMAATAGSVAVGSTIGHGLSSMLFGGGGGHSQPVEQSPPVQQQQQTFQQSGISCETQAKGSSHSYPSFIRLGRLLFLGCFSTTSTDFTKCLEAADVQTCSWFLEQLKAVSQIYSDALIEARRADSVTSVPVCCLKILDSCHVAPSRPISITSNERIRPHSSTTTVRSSRRLEFVGITIPTARFRLSERNHLERNGASARVP